MTLRAAAEDRILGGVTRATAAHGYSELTVQRVLAASGVSRATFYSYFTSLDECFLLAYRMHAAKLVSEVRVAVRAAAQPEMAALSALVSASASRPDVARMLMSEGLAAGAPGRLGRDALLAELGRVIARGGAPSLDLPTETLLGAVFRFLSMWRLGEAPASVVRSEMLSAVSAFARGPGRESWTDRFVPQVPRASSLPAPSRGQMRREGTSYERILHATSLVIREKGYRELTVSDVVAAAGVSRRSFYNEFAGKSAVSIAAYERGLQDTVAACAPAFFSSGSWPERVWATALAFTGFLAREPLIAYLGFVEVHAIGRDFVPRVHDTQLAFTLFLDEGFRQRPDAALLPRSAAAFTTAMIAELGFQGTRSGAGEYLRRLLPLAVYLALAPFVGRDAAGAFVAGKLSRGRGAAAA